MSGVLSDLDSTSLAEDDVEAEPTPVETNPGRNVAQILAQILVNDAIPKSQRRHLDRREAVCLAITVPGVDWCEPIATAIERQWPHCRVFARDGSSRSQHVPTRGNDEVAYVLARGGAVIGVSHAPARHLPSALVHSADAHVSLVAPTGQQMRRVLDWCAERPTPRVVPDDAATGLSFSEIVAAIRAGQSAHRALANMARTRAAKTAITPNDDTPRLESLVGLGPAKEWGLSVIDSLEAWKRGVPWTTLSTSAVIFGPPGVGKSLMARALAKSCGATYIGTSVGSWFSNSEGHLDDVVKFAQSQFDLAKAQTPSLLFIDEIDSVPSREAMSRRNKDFWTPVVNFLLTLFDSGVTNRDGIILLGATNYVNHLDKALVRPGRFDRMIEITMPSCDEIADIMRMHLGADLPDADLRMVAKLGGRATGAMASGWVRQARAKAIASGRPLSLDDLIAVVAPKEVRSRSDVWRVAVHEAGHAVAYLHFGYRLGDVSLVASSTSEGRVEASFAGSCPTANDLESMAICLLAGRAAEIMILGSPSAGAENDLARATRLVAASLMSFGFGRDLVHLAGPDEAVKMIRRDSELRSEVSRRLAALQEAANTIVSRNPSVETLARELMARRALGGDEVRQIVEGVPL